MQRLCSSQSAIPALSPARKEAELVPSQAPSFPGNDAIELLNHVPDFETGESGSTQVPQ